ncbi:hypothetical protein BH10BDE1_BH10BDE1_13000 [soil metagenome]
MSDTLGRAIEATTDVVTAVPPMLRDELFHPAVVHFPIAFLALSGLLACFWFFSRRGLPTLLFIAILAVVGGWAGILTGGWSEDVVNRVVCDPTVTQLHEQWAEWAVWTASAGLPLLLFAALRGKKGVPTTYRAVVALVFTFVAGAVLYAGHLGARLVYQQAAAVHQPSPQCTEFE